MGYRKIAKEIGMSAPSLYDWYKKGIFHDISMANKIMPALAFTAHKLREYKAPLLYIKEIILQVIQGLCWARSQDVDLFLQISKIDTGKPYSTSINVLVGDVQMKFLKTFCATAIWCLTGERLGKV